MSSRWLSASLLAAVLGGCGAPLEPAPPEQLWVDLTMGSGHGCVLDADGRIACFGANGRGQLGLGSSGEPPTPAYLPVGAGFVQLDAGAFHTCAIGPSGGVWCWGANDDGQLGLGDQRDRDLPTRLDLPGVFQSVTAGFAHSCATRSDGLGLCWGTNRDGRLGLGVQDPGPFGPTVLEGKWASLAAGGRHGCGIDVTGAAYCWGWNEFGQLGTGTKASVSFPTRVSTAETLLSPGVGGDFSCALDTSSRLFCWGGSEAGFPLAEFGPALGTPRLWDRRPVADYGLDDKGLCAVFFDGGVKCVGPQWAAGTVEAGIGDSPGVARVAVGASLICVLLGPGSLKCL